MATRKTRFEVVRLADIAPSLTDVEVFVPAEQEKLKLAPQPARILSVTYDHSLAVTRAMLFNSVGFQVSSATTLDQAIQFCAHKKFELIVIGHSIALENRRLLIKELRRRCTTPLLALQRPGGPPVTDVDYVFDSTQSPALLLEEVINILKPHSSPDRGKSDD